MKFFTTRRIHSFLIVLPICIISNITLAADPEIYSNRNGAIRGADPVAYFSLEPGEDAVMGTDEFTYQWSGATWKFSNAQNRDLFIANPKKFAPQFGGYCAFAVSHNFTKTVKPDVWEIVDGKLYLNYNRRAYKKWAADKADSISRGDTNWPTVLKECEEHNNCRK